MRSRMRPRSSFAGSDKDGKDASMEQDRLAAVVLPHHTPDRWQHRTTRNNDPDVFPYVKGGVHRWESRPSEARDQLLRQTTASAPHGPRKLKQVTLRKPPTRYAKTQNAYSPRGVWGYVVHAAEAETLKLRYGQAYSSAHSIFSLPVAVADQEGLFAREGLKVDIIVPIPGGSDKMIAALHDEWVDLTHVATPFLIRAALAGSDAGDCC